MPKQLRITVAVIVLVIVAGFVYLLTSGKAETNESATNKEQTKPQPVAAAETRQADSAGAYVDYSRDVIASTSGTKILFFHAPWCPQCRQLDESIRSGSIPANVTIIKVDYDTNQKLRQQYGVTMQTTLVLLDGSGNEADKYVAYDQPNLSAVIENLL